MATTLVTNCSLGSGENSYVWYCKTGQMPMAVEFMGSEGEPTTAALLNGYIFEGPSKYLCLYLGSVLLVTLVREVPLCSGQQSAQDS